ncbi:MAG: hypothetical protein N4Q15_02920 [Lactobacillus crispatus]|nr:hypothetical protein [Lactobacillus crispatus]
MKFYLTSQKYANSNPNLTAYEIDQISKAYLGKLSNVCTVEVWLPSNGNVNFYGAYGSVKQMVKDD